jgi:hypothetical protein
MVESSGQTTPLRNTAKSQMPRSVKSPSGDMESGSDEKLLKQHDPSHPNQHSTDHYEIRTPTHPAAPQHVIYLKERSLKMLKNDLIFRNPLRVMQKDESVDTLAEGGFGAVLARAGVGKTALLVQLALNSMLRGKNVLHISLNDPVNKVNLWYEEVFRHIARQYAVKQANELWNTLLPHRFIMTFRVEGFSVPKLEERLTDLTAQSIFTPHMIIIDGFPFNESTRAQLSELKILAKKLGCHMWFTVRTHRDEAPDPNGMPRQLDNVADLFEVIIQLQPDGKEIHIRALKGREAEANESILFLDPSTMLITDDK